MTVTIEPGLEALERCIADNGPDVTLYPLYTYVSAEETTPHAAYLKLARLDQNDHVPSFLLESAKTMDAMARFSYMGVAPRRVLRTNAGAGDPLKLLAAEFARLRPARNTPQLPGLSGGAVGYVSYDCVRYFEPRTARELADPLELPEAALMLFDTVVAYDHVFHRFQVVHNMQLEPGIDLNAAYEDATRAIRDVVDRLTASTPVPQPPQPPIRRGQEFSSNVGQQGYEEYVRRLKEHIYAGDIIQAVPSQRVARPTSLHPFNIYRQLRMVNPSPYMFYLDYGDFQVVGASPELLCKVDEERQVVTHPIAGTIRRGVTQQEDDALAAELRNSVKDRAEHVMLVDLARNDINRVCDPLTTRVDKLMTVQRFSHVQHLVSEVTGTLRPDKDRFDAFRSVFPAGTVSGAPKVRAMELIGELEGERRGVYAGAVGHWSYDGVSMDTCIALRTMVYKGGVAYLQAGGGIVHDSDPYDEYVETMNKMLANHNTILQAEELWAEKIGSE
ncbi:ABR209Wp [Eremothecium gossypii ATCC 10895]|uniref:anthranilate synthase n=1 Tax=Eremothecium gossypii (strain ATCC 10895 / CBS 109.51 / FGSC 9923 / NRRL Y-1056) TaxID=284811 RepID=Q75D13_EREGS|nr:ABR209Wp [Eremothecium gossypii ATCC 10895]AAS50982.1 ABR209Wp [Eremothecium gossypii ATCC 10895]AEY95271.1 FABR209Wp [Eremothecium gossypii FDAG1]